MEAIKNTNEMYDEPRIGISYKCNYGEMLYYLIVFRNKREAEEWLNREEFDFRYREILTVDEAEDRVGEEPVEYAFIAAEYGASYSGRQPL